MPTNNTKAAILFFKMLAYNFMDFTFLNIQELKNNNRIKTSITLNGSNKD